MVLNTTQATSELSLDNKENVVVKPNQSALRHSNGRRPRSRPNTSPSPVLLAREAVRDSGGRRLAQSPVASSSRSIETNDIEMSDSTTPAGESSSQRRVQLPKFLRRPVFRAISPEAIAAINPDLRDVAIEYIHQALQAAGPQLLHVASSTTANHPPRLPRDLQVVVNDITADAPTHLFAVYLKSAAYVALQPSHVTLHPVHAIILAAHCAHLPPLPPSAPTPCARGTTVTLPVVPLGLPSPTTFSILMHYLYTKRVDQLFAALLSILPHDSLQYTEQLPQTLAATFTRPVLLSHAMKVHGLWSNVAALGIFDEALWRTIEMVWAFMLDALSISTGATWKKTKEGT